MASRGDAPALGGDGEELLLENGAGVEAMGAAGVGVSDGHAEPGGAGGPGGPGGADGPAGPGGPDGGLHRRHWGGDQH